MKDNDFDLDILENADDAEIRKIADNCPASESDRERMFAMSRKIYNERTKESKEAPVIEVSGVEIYKRPLWHKIVSAAAVIALIAGGTTGGMAMLKKNRSLNASVPDNSTIQPSADTESHYPFGEIDRVLIMTSAIAPALFEPSEKVFLELTKAFQSGEWATASNDTPFPDGETVQLFFYNNGNPYKLVLYGDHTMLWDNSTETARYSVSEEIEQAVYNAAKYDIESLDRLIYNDDTDDLIHSVWNNLSDKQDGVLSEDIKYYTVYNPVTDKEQIYSEINCSLYEMYDSMTYYGNGYDMMDHVTELINKAEWNEINVPVDPNDKKMFQLDLHNLNNNIGLYFWITENGEATVEYYAENEGFVFSESESELYHYYTLDDNSKKEIKALIDRYVAEYNEILENCSIDKFIEHFGCDEIGINIHQAIVTLNTATLTNSERDSFLNALSAEELEDITAEAPVHGNIGSETESFDLIGHFADGNKTSYHILFQPEGTIFCSTKYTNKTYKISQEFREFADKLAEKYKENNNETVTIPPVDDIHIDLAKVQLKERGLEVIIEKTEDITVRPNYVIKSEPAEGKEVPKGSTVKLYISSDSSSEEMSMEDYRGMNIKEATVIAGYRRLRLLTESVSSSEKKGIVVDQSPEAGEAVNAGDEITLYFSDGQGT